MGITLQLVTASELNTLRAGSQGLHETTDTQFDSPLLHIFVSAERKHIHQTFSEYACSPGEIIFREGEIGEMVYLIRAGQVAVVKGDLAAPMILGYRKAGEVIGEMALLENQPRSASVIALDAASLLGITRENFRKLLRETPSVSLSVLSMLSARLRISDEARSSGALSEKRLIGQVSELQNEKQRLEELQRFRQETSDLVIHDLRNPLANIGLAVKMISVSLPEEVLQANQELLDIALSSCDRMLRLVNSLLEVSRIEAGESPLTLTDLNVCALIEDIITQIAPLDRHNVHLQSRSAENLPMVQADRDKIERVLFNLVDNALKYTPDQGTITLAAERQSDALRISVTDTGPGIPSEERERIFARFTQTAGEKPRRRGFGLGLAYCRLAVEAHGGRIWVEPGDENNGSRFIFTLPIHL